MISLRGDSMNKTGDDEKRFAKPSESLSPLLPNSSVIREFRQANGAQRAPATISIARIEPIYRGTRQDELTQKMFFFLILGRSPICCGLA